MEGVTVRPVETAEDLATSVAIRHEVFVKGQNVPQEREQDGTDAQCRIYLAYVDGQAIGTARVYPAAENIGKIERMAVLDQARGRGIGQSILDFIVEDMRQQGVSVARLESQVHAIPFYEKAGFKAFGEEFMDAGIPHRKMEIEL